MKPERLVSPMPKPEVQDLPGCGGKNPELDEVDRTKGCGGLPIPEQKPEDFILQAKPVGNKKDDTKDFYSFDHGTYRPSAKHHVNSPNDVGKPPRDGQAALDNSFLVKGSRERVAVQDGKVIILKYEEQGVYHGYIDINIKTLDPAVKDALIENGYLKDAKSKKLIKDE